MAGILLRVVQNLVRPTAPSLGFLSMPAQHILSQTNPINFDQTRGAARKGIRMKRAREARARANKRRLLEAQNPVKKEHKKNVKIDKSQLRLLNERELDQTLPEAPSDDVYFYEKFKRRKLNLDEILNQHRQAMHPEVFNQPDSLVLATVELNLKMKIKKRKYIEKVDSTLCFPHKFKFYTRPRKIVALCKDEALQQACREAGATLSGGGDVTALLKSNQLTQRDFDHIVCHNDFLVDFAAVKGMKGMPFFPTKARGNFGEDLVELVKFFRDGLDYSLTKNLEEPSYGFVECPFGRLDMPDDQLLENITHLLQSINRFKPLNLADGKQFFQRVYISTPSSSEIFLLKFWELLDGYADPDTIIHEGEKDEQSLLAVQK